MTELVITKCIAPNCEREISLDSALCRICRDKLRRAEAGILRDAGNTVGRDMRQFEALMYHEDDVTLEGVLDRPRLLTAEDIAHRMVKPVKWVRGWLRKFKDDMYRG